MCSFCVRLWGWNRSLCLSALPSYRAPDEVIRTGYRCSSSSLPISGWRCCGALSDRYFSCGVLFSVSVFQVPRLFSPGRVSVFPEGCGLDCILCPSWRLCTAGFTAPALPMISAPPLCFGVCICTASLSSPPLCFGVVNKDYIFSLAIGSRASVP